jgi:hypothetical protein
VDENFEHQDATTEAAVLVGHVVMTVSDIQAVQDVTTEAAIRAAQGVTVVESVTHDVA